MFKRIALSASLLMISPLAAAHLEVESPSEASPGQDVNIVLQVPHGCEGQSTKEIAVSLPEGFLAAKAQPKAGWKLDIKEGDYQKSYELWGHSVKKGPVQITWSGGELKDSEFDQFVIHGVIASEIDPAKQEKLYFPTVQRCSKLTAQWTDTSGEPTHGHHWDKPMASPFVKLVKGAAEAADGHHHH